MAFLNSWSWGQFSQPAMRASKRISMIVDWCVAKRLSHARGNRCTSVKKKMQEHVLYACITAAIKKNA